MDPNRIGGLSVVACRSMFINSALASFSKQLKQQQQMQIELPPSSFKLVFQVHEPSVIIPYPFRKKKFCAVTITMI
jgi:hypothetical protein